MPKKKANKQKKQEKQVSIVVKAKAPVNKPKAPAPPRPANVARICGLVDPFCEHARGAKFSDASNARTLTQTIRNNFTITADADGYKNVICSVQYGYWPFATATAYTYSNVTAWNSFGAETAALAGVVNYRVVSAGLRLKRISPSLTTSGLVSLRFFGVESNECFAAINTLTFNCIDSLDIPLGDCHDLAVVFKHNSQNPQRMHRVSTDTGVVTSTISNGFLPFTICVNGGPASAACLSCQFHVNYEVMFDDTSGLAQIATPAVRDSPVIVDAAAKLTSSIPSYFTEGVRNVGSWVRSEASAALRNTLATALRSRSNSLALMVD